MGRNRQYADRVNVIKQVKHEGKWRFAPLVQRNGKIVRDHVWINGTDEHHTEGSYYLEWYEDGGRRRQPIDMFEKVVPSARAKAIELQARKAGILVTLPAQPSSPSPSPGPVDESLATRDQSETESRVTMADAVQRYMDFVQRQRSLRTFRTYRVALKNYFTNCYKKTYLDEVAREDLLAYSNFLFDRGLEAGSVSDKLITVATFLKWSGIPRLLERSDWPKYTETIRPVYEPEELHAMLEEATPSEALLMKFFLCSGFRNRETRFAAFFDLDPRNGLIRVTKKALWAFTPKNHEERSVPLPESMLEQLLRWKAGRNAGAADLIFPNTKGKPDTLHCEIVKRVGWRARLNCGQCLSEHGYRCAEGPYCERIFLHKFRHTFATQHLRDGIDIRTLQNWMGHRDLKATMVYLKGIQSRDAVAKVNAGSLAAYVA
ncbi:MAG TPA: tyrosine-type recombinase/integrase [Edaphobacter sp.]